MYTLCILHVFSMYSLCIIQLYIRYFLYSFYMRRVVEINIYWLIIDKQAVFDYHLITLDILLFHSKSNPVVRLFPLHRNQTYFSNLLHARKAIQENCSSPLICVNQQLPGMYRGRSSHDTGNSFSLRNFNGQLPIANMLASGLLRASLILDCIWTKERHLGSLAQSHCASPACYLSLIVIFVLSPFQRTIEMTDGWYPIRAILDKPLSSLLLSNKIQIGTKLCIYGANLIGSDQAAPPLEV